MLDYPERFGGVGRLFGVEAMGIFRDSRVWVIGLGGVGSWVVEALARSGVGTLTLMDFDDVCVTNINRQLPALSGTVGRPKADVLAERVAAIWGDCDVRSKRTFLTRQNAAEWLKSGVADLVVDATDHAETKAIILDGCYRAGLLAITAGGAGGRRDATRIRVGNLAATGGDALLKQVRRDLRKNHGWPYAESFGMRAVYSSEPPWYPVANGAVCQVPVDKKSLRMDCASGYGAACHVTGVFGFALAGEVLHQLLLAKSPAAVL